MFTNYSKRDTMESVYAIFEFLNESTWIDFLPDYGFHDFNRSNPRSDPEMLHTILTELHESSWADMLDVYKRDIEEDLGIPFMSVRDMRNVYLRNALLKIDGVGFDIADTVANMV